MAETVMESALKDQVGIRLVENIHLRKEGYAIILDKTGKRLKPVAQVIYRQAYAKLAKGTNPDEIVANLEKQILLLM